MSPSSEKAEGARPPDSEHDKRTQRRRPCYTCHTSTDTISDLTVNIEACPLSFPEGEQARCQIEMPVGTADEFGEVQLLAEGDDSVGAKQGEESDGLHDFPSTRSTTQQPRTCGP